MFLPENDSFHCYMEIKLPPVLKLFSLLLQIQWKASGIVCISVFECVKREPWDEPKLQTSALKAFKESERRAKECVCACVEEFGLMAEWDLGSIIPDW